MPARASGKYYFTKATTAIKKACGISEIVKPSGDMIQDQATIPIPKTKSPCPKRAERSSIEALSALMTPNMDKTMPPAIIKAKFESIRCPVQIGRSTAPHKAQRAKYWLCQLG
jgi:hypothetical protein